MAVIDLFDRGTSLDPSRPFAVDSATSITFGEAAELSRRIANGLRSRGIGLGSRVAVHAPNSALGFVSILGVFRSGAAWVTLNHRDGLEAKLDLLGKTRADGLFYGRGAEDELDALLRGAPGLRWVLSLEPSQSLPYLGDWARKFDATCPPSDACPDDPAILDATGGTTGTPKAAVQTHRTLEAMVANVLAAMPPDPGGSVCLVATPMTHGAGNLAHALMGVGATNVLLPRFDPEEVLTAIERHRVTHLFLPPTAVYLLLASGRAGDFDLSSLRYFVYGGAPMSMDKLEEAMDAFGPVMTQVYGQAEACLICTCLTPRDHTVARRERPQRLWSCGRPALLTPVAIMDDEGGLLPAGERGEVVVRGSLVMAGYFEDQEATQAVSAGGWHRTGDIGYVDEEGFVYIVDRKKEMIISGGFNVFPIEVERVILSHGGVADCAVVGAPDEKWGEAVVAVVETKRGAAVSADELISLCRRRLGGVKAPKRVEIWPELPRSANGKVVRRDVRASFWPTDSRRAV